MTNVPRLHAITTREILERESFLDQARSLLGLGEVALHLRARGDNGLLLLQIARELRTAHPAAVLLVNDRVDVAAIAGTGVHLPEAGLTAAQARTILGSRALVGRSLHDPPAGALDPGDLAGLDYAFYGHVFPTRSKAGIPARGVDGLARFGAIAEHAGVPVLAIGGVTPDRVAAVIHSGAYGVAVLSGIWDETAPDRAAERYLHALVEALASSGATR
jgi:thiazole tautomerase (transcriptional regulator TenI)